MIDFMKVKTFIYIQLANIKKMKVYTRGVRAKITYFL